MVTTQMPPAGWYADPDDANVERYWSGAEWSDQRRPRPPALAPISEAAVESAKKHWHLGWVPLAEAVEGLQSSDTATRVAAARSLASVRRRDDAEGRRQVEMACLTDPVPEVRHWALRAMLTPNRRFTDDRMQLVSLLLSTQEADAATKAWVLHSIAEMIGPGSPYGRFVKGGIQGSVVGGPGTPGVFDDVLDRADSAATVVPVLEVAAAVGMAPYVTIPWVSHPATKQKNEELARTLGSVSTTSELTLPTFHWPDRCGACGRPHPREHQALPFSAKWKHQQQFQVDYRTTRTETESSSVTGSLVVPVCGVCGVQLPSPTASEHELKMAFPSPSFVAELLYPHDAWSVVKGSWYRS